MKSRKKQRNKLDEMQEQKLLQIEHTGCWLAFWGLAVSLLVQCCMGLEWNYLAGEWVVFMSLSLYVTIACMRNGIWDRKLEPTPKVILGSSAIAGLICGFLQFTRSYREYHALFGSIAAGIFMMGFTAVLCYAVMSIAASIYRSRVKRLESEEEEDGKQPVEIMEREAERLKEEQKGER